MYISVVTPVYGCRGALFELYRRLTEVLDNISHEYEIIMVDDRCPQGSWEDIEKLCDKDNHVKGIRLSRNFGQPAAILAGVEESAGEWVVVMDCDLQDRPEAINDLYKKAMEGYDVVFARRVKRKDSLIVKALSRLYYKCFDLLTGAHSDNTVGNFSISKRIVIDSFLKIREQGRAYQLFIKWVGFDQTSIDIEGDIRYEGRSSYNFLRKMRFAVSSVTSLSNRPLYISIGLGMIFTFMSVLAIIGLIIRRVMDPTTQLGWTSLLASIYLVGGMLMMSIGLAGIYIGNIFTETKHRPIYIVSEKRNCRGRSGETD